MRACLFVVALVLAVAGCSAVKEPSAAKEPSSSPSASRAAPSAFCLDLDVFQVAVLFFRTEAGEYALSGKPIDPTVLRQRASLIDRYGKEMAASAPADIRESFTTVLDAVAKADGLLDGHDNRQLAALLLGSANTPAFEAVERYDCASPSRTA
jgi:hypothetical protein